MGEQGPAAGCLGLQGCGRDPAPTASHTHVPPQLQLTLRFCFAATAKQVLLGYKKALEAGQAGRAVGIHARALAGCHWLTCQGKQCYLPMGSRHKEHHNSGPNPKHGVTGQSRAGSGSPSGAGLPRARGDCPTRGCACGECGTGPMAPPVAPRCRCRAGWPCWPPCPHRGRHCTDAILLCRASSDSLLISRQRGGKRAGTSAEVGLFSGKTKAAWPVPRPRGCSGLEELPEDRAPKSGAASVRVPVVLQGGPNPNPGQPHCPTCHPMAVGVCVTRPFV